MNATFRAGLVAGVILGVALGGFGVLLFRRPAPSPTPAPPSSPPITTREVAALRDEIDRLRKQSKDLLERAKTDAPPAPATPPPAPETPKARTEDSASPQVRELFFKLASLGVVAALQSPKLEELMKALKEAGKPGLEVLMNALRASTSGNERFLAAALMEKLGDASAIPSLAEALKTDKDMMVRRMASHAIAVIGNPEGTEALRAASGSDADWGVRVNSAYGLAKLGNEEGLRMLQEAYESASTPVEYRLAVLSGLADVAAPSTAPLFRQILSDSKDAGYLLTAISALQKMKDAASIPALQQVVASTQPEIVKQAASKAIEEIQK